MEQTADAQVTLLAEIRDILAQTNGNPSGTHAGADSKTTPPTTAERQ